MTVSTTYKLLLSALLAAGMTIGASGVAMADRAGQGHQDDYEHTEQDRTSDAVGDEEAHEGFDHDQDEETMDAQEEDDFETDDDTDW